MRNAEHYTDLLSGAPAWAVEQVTEEIELLENKLILCREAMQSFVDRCNAGTIKSTWTKSTFEEVLKQTK